MEDVEEQGHGVSDSLASPGFAYEAAMGQRGTKRTRNGESLMREVPEPAVDTRGIAKGIAASQGPAKLREPDSLIVGTERVLDQLFKQDYTGTRSDAILDDAAQDLQNVWDEHARLTDDEVTTDTFGPHDDRNVIGKANFIAGLLLRLHHPAAFEVPQEEAHLSRSLRSLRAGEQRRLVYMPKILFEWLNEHHDPAGDMLSSVLNHKEGYALAADFWDCVYSCLFRGRFVEAIQILEGANFPAAEQYSDRENENILSVVEQTCAFIANCPVLKDDDWDMKGPAWRSFRRQAEEGLVALRDYVEGDMPGSDDLAAFHKSGRGNRMTLSTASRRAELEVPYEIYEPLQEVYKLLMGNMEDLGKSAFDWLEATMGLTAWWDGEDGPAPRGSLARSRQSVNRMQHSRPADVTPALAYRQKLAATLAQVLEEGELKETFDASDPLHIAIASILQSDIESALTIVKGWSITLTAATAELANAAGWLPDSRPGSRDPMRGLDQSDLMVLSYGDESVNNRTSIKDEILVEYADLLASKPQIQTSLQGLSLEGWQLALSILARVDDVQAVDAKANAILDKIPLDSSERVDALLDLCADLSFTTYGTKIAEVCVIHIFYYRYPTNVSLSQKFADQLSSTSTSYGTAILYYARAHNSAKVKQTLNVLISLSLIQSLAYPPSSALDDSLNAFLASPKTSLTQLASVDAEAAKTLSCYLSGYATLRDFYERRDDSRRLGAKEGIAQRKRDAAPYLIAAITSAAESIAGGLFDPSVDAVVPVDTLLCLFGEALPLLNQPEPILSTEQLGAVLRAAEDLQTVSPKVFARAEELGRSALANAAGKEAPSPKALLKKRESSGLSGSAFSFVGSQMLGSQESGGSGRSGRTSEGSGVLVAGNVKRGWDWRRGVGQSASGEDVLKVLRWAVAGEVGRGWSSEE